MTKKLNDVELAISWAKRRGITVKAFCREINMPFLPGAGWMFARAQLAGSSWQSSAEQVALKGNQMRLRCSNCGKARVYCRSKVAQLSRPYKCASCTRKAEWEGRNG